jgi:hypothetical protein
LTPIWHVLWRCILLGLVAVTCKGKYNFSSHLFCGSLSILQTSRCSSGQTLELTFPLLLQCRVSGNSQDLNTSQLNFSTHIFYCAHGKSGSIVTRWSSEEQSRLSSDYCWHARKKQGFGVADCRAQIKE